MSDRGLFLSERFRTGRRCAPRRRGVPDLQPDQALGLEIARRDEDRIAFRCGSGSQLVVTLSTTGTSDTQTQLSWRVRDLLTELAALRARGVRIETYEASDPVSDAAGVADVGHPWAAWIIDPDGNALGIVEPKPMPRA